MPSFKASKDRLTLLGVNTSGGCKLKPGTLKNDAKSTLPMLQKRNNKAWWQHIHLFTKWFTEYFKPTVETYCSEKRSPSKHDCSLTMHLVTQEFWWRCRRSKLCSHWLITSILEPMDQGVVLTFKPYYLRNTFHKATATIDSDSSDGSEQSQLKTSRMDSPF